MGLLVFIFGSTLCIFATEYWLLLSGRLLQGVGIAGPAVLSYLVIADTYSTGEQQRLMGILNGVITLAMAFAPVIGSYVNLFFNWQGNFVVLLVLGIISLGFGMRYLPEGEVKPHIKIALKEYVPVLKNPIAIGFIITICFLIIPYWVFIGMSPILYMGNLGVSLNHFGYYQGAIAGMFSIVSLSSAYFLGKYGQKNCFYVGIGGVVAGGLAITGLVVAGVENPMIITAAMILLACGAVYPINILWPLSLASVGEAKGRMAAMIIASRLLLTSIGLQITGYFYHGTFLYIGLVMLASLAIGLWACYKLFQAGGVRFN
jgi:DHA1 family bicyclomycin/chloramphenicol resistance-like MFS transporter